MRQTAFEIDELQTAVADYRDGVRDECLVEALDRIDAQITAETDGQALRGLTSARTVVVGLLSQGEIRARWESERIDLGDLVEKCELALSPVENDREN